MYKKDEANLEVNAQKALLGSIVLTRYNNKCYKIDDINFSMNCLGN